MSAISVTEAHGTGASLERVVGDLLVDIGYAPEAVTAGVPIPFDFALQEVATGEPVEFTDIWVRVHRERDTLFAGGIARSQIGTTNMLFQFPGAGAYTLSVRFQEGGVALAESSFELAVAPSEAPEEAGGTDVATLVLLLLGAIALGGVGWYAHRRLQS